MLRDVFFINYCECDFSGWYTEIQKKDSYKLTQKDKEQSQRSLNGSYSDEKLALNSKAYAHLSFAWITFTIFYLDHHIWNDPWSTCLPNPPWRFLHFPGFAEMKYKINFCGFFSNNTSLYSNPNFMMVSNKQQKMPTCTDIDCKCWKWPSWHSILELFLVVVTWIDWRKDNVFLCITSSCKHGAFLAESIRLEKCELIWSLS